MSAITQRDHPTEDVLTEFALYGEIPSVAEHVDACCCCTEAVAEIRAIKESILEIEDEEVPDALREKILSLAQKKADTHCFIQNWYRNPSVLVAGTIGTVLVLYLLFLLLS